MTRPAQYFTPNTGQRPFTFVDIINGINDQINGINDVEPSAADSGVIDNLYADVDSDKAITSGTISISTTTSSQIVWDGFGGYQFYQGAWR